MATLTEVAPRVLETVRELDAHAVEAAAAVARARDELTRAGAELQPDWDRLEAQVRALATHAEGVRRQMSAGVERVVRTVDALEASLAGLQHSATAQLEQAATSAEASGQAVTAAIPALEGSTAAAAAASDAMVERLESIAAGVHAGFAAAADQLDALAAGSRQARDDLAHVAGEVRRRLDEECASELEAAHAAWAQRLAEVRALLDRVLADAHAHAEELADFALEEYRREQEEAFASLAEPVQSVEAALAALAQLAEGAEERAGRAGDSAEGGADQAAAATRRAVGALQAVLQALSRHGFSG